MPATAKAALILVVNNIEGEKWYTSTRQLQAVSLEVCVAIRKIQRAKIVVHDNTPPRLPTAVAGEVHHYKQDSAQATRVPRIRVLSVTWNLLSTVALTRYTRALVDVKEMVFGERFNDRVQEVRWPDSVVCLEFGTYFEQEIEGVQWPSFLEELTFGSLFNRSLGGAQWPSTLKWILVSDDFVYPTDGITSSAGSAVEVLMPWMLD